GRGCGLDLEVVPDGCPETLEVGHRPAPELVVAVMVSDVEVGATTVAEPAGERDDVGALDPLRTRSPQQVAFPSPLVDSHPRSPPSGTLRSFCHGHWRTPHQVTGRGSRCG